jgi:hypothetical protein
MKAKLAFVEGENAAMREELGRVEAALAGKRDELAAHKVWRGRQRREGGRRAQMCSALSEHAPNRCCP